MLKRFFITGTDTSVGKTVVSRALLQALASGGKSVAGYKPVAKGSKETPEGLRNKDALVLQSVSTIELPYEAVNPIALSGIGSYFEKNYQAGRKIIWKVL